MTITRNYVKNLCKKLPVGMDIVSDIIYEFAKDLRLPIELDKEIRGIKKVSIINGRGCLNCYAYPEQNGFCINCIYYTDIDNAITYDMSYLEFISSTAIISTNSFFTFDRPGINQGNHEEEYINDIQDQEIINMIHSLRI